MGRSTVATVAVGLLLFAGGGWFVYETQVACNGCGNSEYANDLALENQRAERVDVAITVRENGSVVATANETLPARDRVVLTDLVAYGTYDLTVRHGDETFRTRWAARGCHYQAVVVENATLDGVHTVC